MCIFINTQSRLNYIAYILIYSVDSEITVKEFSIRNGSEITIYNEFFRYFIRVKKLVGYAVIRPNSGGAKMAVLKVGRRCCFARVPLKFSGFSVHTHRVVKASLCNCYLTASPFSAILQVWHIPAVKQVTASTRGLFP